jgi:hypothetical protein
MSEKKNALIAHALKLKRGLGSKLNYTLYKRQIKLVNSDLTIGFQKKKAKS